MISEATFSAAADRHVQPSGFTKAPVAMSAALTRAGRGAFDMWDESDDLPSLAMIIPLAVLSIYTIWAVVSSL